jgi:hypothetical protein
MKYVHTVHPCTTNAGSLAALLTPTLCSCRATHAAASVSYTDGIVKSATFCTIDLKSYTQTAAGSAVASVTPRIAHNVL